MKNKIYLLTLMFIITLFYSCDKEDVDTAISRPVLDSWGVDFAVLQGRIYESAAITQSGVCWVSRAIDPEIDYPFNSNTHDLQFAIVSDNVFEQQLSVGQIEVRTEGLEPNMVHFLRLFVETSEGVAYSYPVKVITGKSYDDRSFVEVGKFMLGNNLGAPDEMPQHEVELEGNLYMSKREITNTEYCNFLNNVDVEGEDNRVEVDENGNSEKYLFIDMASAEVLIEYADGIFTPRAGSEELPVICVTWHGADAYCERTGGRLPTEAEWEFISKEGLTQSSYIYSGSDQADQVGWFDGTELKTGGLKKANSLDIFDMSGNVAEWCSDWYAEDTYSEQTLKNPIGPESGSTKVVRGGNYTELPITVTTRNSMDPLTASSNVGFRVLYKL